MHKLATLAYLTYNNKMTIEGKAITEKDLYNPRKLLYHINEGKYTTRYINKRYLEQIDEIYMLGKPLKLI